MDKVTQSNAANAEESAAAAEELNAQAEVMKQAVSELMQLVGGAAEAPPSARSPQPGRRLAAKPASRPQPSNGHAHGANGHAAQPVASASRRQEIPMDDDFKNF
jgi:methyl-accepting chemotaxis protein